jgi:hypothetical protein
VASTSAGVETSFSLQKGTTYRLVVTGYYSHGSGTQLADAACSWHRSDDAGWSATPEGTTSTTARKLLVGGAARWTAVSGGACDTARHAYVWDYVPTSTGPVTLALDDASRSANTGTLSVRILKAGASTSGYSTALPASPLEPSAPAEADTDGPSRRWWEDTVTVVPGKAAKTEVVLRKGRTYDIRVEGTWSVGDGVLADAECTKAPNGTWQRKRSADPLHPDLDTYDLYVDGVDLASSGCREDHVYTYEYEPARDGKATFALWDPQPADDSGSVEVTVSR